MLVVERWISFGIKNLLIEVEAAIKFADCKLNVVNASKGWKLRSVLERGLQI
jgi:hypothetical protein